MKIGHPAEKPITSPATAGQTAAADATKVGSAGAAPAGVTGTPDASATVAISSTASTLLSSGSSEFDAHKVGLVSDAIASGSFKIHPEVIADKLISNARELLGKATG